MVIEINADKFRQWANDNLNFQNENQEQKLVIVKEFKKMLFESTKKNVIVAFKYNNKVVKDTEI